MPGEALIAGYFRFRRGAWAASRARFEALAEGQKPRAMIIGCCDSRVDPAAIFDCAPGELFIARNVGALVPPWEPGGGQHGVSAAVEFAVLGLGVERILVLGHGRCGGVAAALDGHGLAPPETSLLTRWVGILDGARAEVEAQAARDPALDRHHALELAAIRTSIANLRTFPFVAEREAAGRLRLAGAHFGIADGHLLVLDGSSFREVPAA
jgi:carbonic anhydrase